MLISSERELGEYGGYYFAKRSDGGIRVRLPGSNEFFVTLSSFELFVRFVDQANNLFQQLSKPLNLHLTGCMRCQCSVNSDRPEYFDPCRTGAPLIAQAKQLAQDVSRQVANDFARYDEQQRLQADDGAGPAEDSTVTSEV